MGSGGLSNMTFMQSGGSKNGVNVMPSNPPADENDTGVLHNL